MGLSFSDTRIQVIGMKSVYGLFFIHLPGFWQLINLHHRILDIHNREILFQRQLACLLCCTSDK